MRYLVFLATIFVTLICPFVCGRSCGSSSEAHGQSVASRRTCCGHCQRKAQREESPRHSPGPYEQGPCERGQCCCPCLCNGAIRAEQVDVPPADSALDFALLVEGLIPLPNLEQEGPAAERSDGPPARSGSERRVALCSLTC